MKVVKTTFEDIHRDRDYICVTWNRTAAMLECHFASTKGTQIVKVEITHFTQSKTRGFEEAENLPGLCDAARGP